MKGLLNVDIETILHVIAILINRGEKKLAVKLCLYIQDNLYDPPKNPFEE